MGSSKPSFCNSCRCRTAAVAVPSSAAQKNMCVISKIERATMALCTIVLDRAALIACCHIRELDSGLSTSHVVMQNRYLSKTYAHYRDILHPYGCETSLGCCMYCCSGTAALHAAVYTCHERHLTNQLALQSPADNAK